MSDVSVYREKARAWLDGQVAQFGRQARRGLSVEEIGRASCRERV